MNPLFLIAGSNSKRKAWFRHIKLSMRMPAVPAAGHARQHPVHPGLQASDHHIRLNRVSVNQRRWFTNERKKCFTNLTLGRQILKYRTLRSAGT
jgi:hypothetical protein